MIKRVWVGALGWEVGKWVAGLLRAMAGVRHGQSCHGTSGPMGSRQHGHRRPLGHNGFYQRPLPMAITNGDYQWPLPMAISNVHNGCYQWPLPMAITNGHYQWPFPMSTKAMTNGHYQWPLPMAMTNDHYQWPLPMAAV